MSTAVHEDETIELLSALVRASSENPPGDTTAPASVITDLLDAESIPYETWEPREKTRSVVARLRGSKGGTGKSLLFNGHIDTVPAGDGWSMDPFGAVIRDGYLYGRGSTDMKAGVASSLMSLVDLKRRSCPFSGEIVFTAVADEENHGMYGTKWLLSHGITADFAVNCEPTNLGLCLGNRGLLMVDVLVKGRSSHGGRPTLGRNAITRALEIIRELERIDLEPTRDDNFKDPVASLSIVGIHGGDKINVIPDRCVFHIDRRMMPNENRETAIRQILDAIQTATGVEPSLLDSDAETIVTPEVWHEPWWIEPDAPYVQQIAELYRRLFQEEPTFEGKSAGTDASHLVKIGNVPTVIFGPGDYRLSHTVDEHVELRQLAIATEFYSVLTESILRP